MTWMELQCIKLSEISQKKDKSHMISLKCEFKKENKAKEQNPRNRLLTVENKLVVTRGEVGGRMKWVMEIKECTCCDEHQVMCGIAESLYCIPETNITLYVNYTRITINT